ncbi:pilus assembly protein CpaB [Photobacterium sanguinicancri]|uniref:pilus assembly protein CpaB n=1 Tax=Photobacterium sanguinicancri TaxID=875932 RepID=UPI0021C46EAC|nr:pilus assembly protein CpaB [Photobacterium sanguinicancri]
MNRKIILLTVFVILASVIFYIKGVISIEDDNSVVQESQIELVSVFKLKNSVLKTHKIKSSDYIVFDLEESQARSQGLLLVSNGKLELGSIYRKDLAKDSFILSTDIANPEDDDYIYLSLGKDKIPYYYEVENSGVLEAIPLVVGDRVSFVATASSNLNIREQGYRDLGTLESRVIISNAKIIKVNRFESVDGGEIEGKKLSIIIALSSRDVLKLEMAQKISEVTLVPSNISNNYMFVGSSDIVDGIHGVRELRAGVDE